MTSVYTVSLHNLFVVLEEKHGLAIMSRTHFYSFSVGVVQLALLLVTQHLVGAVNSVEELIRIVLQLGRLLVRVELARQNAVLLLNLVRTRLRPQTTVSPSTVLGIPRMA